MDYEAFARRTFVIGRQQPGGPAVHAFDLRRHAYEGYVVVNVQPGMLPSGDESSALAMHFATPVLARIGRTTRSASYDGAEMRPPGTAEHFVTAVHSLPPPFVLLDSYEPTPGRGATATTPRRVRSRRP